MNLFVLFIINFFTAKIILTVTGQQNLVEINVIFFLCCFYSLYRLFVCFKGLSSFQSRQTRYINACINNIIKYTKIYIMYVINVNGAHLIDDDGAQCSQRSILYLRVLNSFFGTHKIMRLLMPYISNKN